MDIEIIATAFTIYFCLAQFGIGWYGWRNPRPKYLILRKILSGFSLLWAVFSAYRLVVPEMPVQQQFIAERGMAMWLGMNIAMIILFGIMLIVVRKKYFERMRERDQAAK